MTEPFDPARVALVARLRSLAEKATPGPWSLDYDHRDGGAHQIVYQYQGRTLTLAFMSTSSDDDDDSSDHDAAFIAACDPQTILALLDALSRPVAAPPEPDRFRALTQGVREIVEASEPRPPGGQQVGMQKYQMTPSTRKELRWWLDNYGAVAAPPEGTPMPHGLDMITMFTLIRPWVDGGVTWQEWDAAYTRLEAHFAARSSPTLTSAQAETQLLSRGWTRRAVKSALGDLFPHDGSRT